MTPTLRFRPIGDGDVDEVIALWERCGLTRPWNNAVKDIAFARAGANSDILVACLDGTVAASVMVGHDGHRGAVYYVSVDPERQGRGFGLPRALGQAHAIADLEGRLRVVAPRLGGAVRPAHDDLVARAAGVLSLDRAPRVGTTERAE